MEHKYEYWVEGETEEKLIKVLHHEMLLLISGKVKKFNVVQKKIKKSHLRILGDNTIIILVFDTDIDNKDVLEDNLKLLKLSKKIKQVFFMPQVKTLEDELLRSCNISNVNELINCQSNFKTEFMKCSNLKYHLERTGFDINKMWVTKAGGAFERYESNMEKIKIK